MKKNLIKYTKVLLRRVYRPVKPVLSPLLKKTKMWHVLGLLVVIGSAGSLFTGWRVTPQERAARWPWSSRSHSEMAVAWFEAGDEKKAIDELKLANKLFFIKTKVNKESLLRANNKVVEPEKIRQEIKNWEQVLETMPYFKDVFLRLAVLNYQLYEDEQAKYYFEQAEYLDPNDTEVLEIKKLIF